MSIINAVDRGQYYAVAGHISFTSVKYFDGALHVNSDKVLRWYVYNNSQLIPLAVKHTQCYVDGEGYQHGVFAKSAIIATQPLGYTRVEVHATKETRLIAIERDGFISVSGHNVFARSVIVVGDLTDLAIIGELIHFTEGTPNTILKSEKISEGVHTRIWLFNDSQHSGTTDSHLYTAGALNRLEVGQKLKIVQRAWLQPAWAMPDDDFLSKIKL